MTEMEKAINEFVKEVDDKEERKARMSLVEQEIEDIHIFQEGCSMAPSPAYEEESPWQ